ncbi:MAG: hypothetical protein QGI60_02775 [archaeon]|jgi:hypothetical protein|nr:hypothetical protein [archaeon]
MSTIANKIFKAMEELAEVRHIFQRVPPKHDLEGVQKKSAMVHLKKAKAAIAAVEREFKKKAKK